MTITDAIERLQAAWPSASFSIDVEVWSHVHRGQRGEPVVMWSVYNADDRAHYNAGTLAGAVEEAVDVARGRREAASLAEAEAAVKPVA